MRRRDFTIAALVSPLVMATVPRNASQATVSNSSRGNMTTAYSQSLTADAGVGSNYNYVAVIPASDILATDEGVKLAIRGPASGSTTISAMWIGHPGPGIDFDGNQEQIKFGGLSSLTVGNATVLSDWADFVVDPSKDILVAFSLTGGSGRARRSKTGLGSGYSLHYKAGSGDAGSTTKTLYTAISGATALIEGIEVLPYEEPVTPPASGDLSGMEQVFQGQRVSSGGEFAGESGKYLHLQFRNPSGTGEVGFLYEIDITPEADTVASLWSYNNSIGGAVLPTCNLMFAAGGVSMEMRQVMNEALIGNGYHSNHFLKGGVRTVIEMGDIPLVGLEAGRGVVLRLHTPGVGVKCANFQWREVPASA